MKNDLEGKKFLADEIVFLLIIANRFKIVLGRFLTLNHRDQKSEFDVRDHFYDLTQRRFFHVVRCALTK